MTSLWPPFRKPLYCKGCPLEKKGGPFVPGYGDMVNTRVIVIAEEPGHCEDGTCRCVKDAHPRGRPLVGKSGRKVDVGLGGSREECFLTNVRKCQTEFESKDEKVQSIEHCSKYLQAEMDFIELKQKAAGITNASLLLIGADATKLFLGRSNMQKLHGSVWRRSETEAMKHATKDPFDTSGQTVGDEVALPE